MMGEMAEREPGEQQRIRLNETLNIYDVLILGIELPAVVVAAINRKIEQYYIAEEYKFRVERERRESERKQIEAVGIRNFQQTVSQGISDSYLRWRGIEATLQLAQSTNSKVVIVGGGKDGLPIILGNVDSPAAVPPQPGGTHPEGDPASKERTTAASPARPLEKTTASGLTEPSEKPPTARTDRIAAGRVKRSAGVVHAAVVMAVQPARFREGSVPSGASTGVRHGARHAAGGNSANGARRPPRASRPPRHDARRRPTAPSQVAKRDPRRSRRALTRGRRAAGWTRSPAVL